MNEIPLVDVRASYTKLRTQIDAAISAVVSSGAFIKGPFVERFESDFASALGVEAELAVGCSNGTSALSVALRALGVGAGDEVILPSLTFFATAEAVVNVGATPVFVDIRRQDYNISPEEVEAAITDRTRAVIAVHLYGSPCDVLALRSIVDRRGILLIEDCAQAHLAKLDGTCVGTIGDAGSFSYFPGKNLGAFGDAGLAVFRSASAATFARKYVDHGRMDKYQHQFVGDNLRMDGLQAAVLSVKLGFLEQGNARRREIASLYDASLSNRGFKTIMPIGQPVYHLYVVEVQNRDEVLETMRAGGIMVGCHYPIPCHRQPALKDFAGTSLPETDESAKRLLSLPIFPELQDEAVDHVISQFLAVARP